MGKEDISKKAYLSDKRRFADLFNGTLMKGKQVIDSAALEESPSVISLSNNKGIIERLNDISMVYKHNGSNLILISLENQDYIDYSIPFRVMLEQAMAYEIQLREIRAANECCSLSGSEFLSGIKETDRLLPVIVLVAYWGEDEWRGPKSVHEMLGFNKATEKFREFVPEYRINFVNLKDYIDGTYFKTELNEFAGMYFCRNNKKKLQEYIQSHERCKRMDNDTFWAIVNISSPGCRVILEKYNGKEEIDMCKAMEDIWNEGLEQGRNEGLEQGRNEGLEQGRNEGLVEIISVIKRMMEKGMPAEDIADLMAQPIEHIKKIVNIIQENGALDNTHIAELVLNL